MYVTFVEYVFLEDGQMLRQKHVGVQFVYKLVQYFGRKFTCIPSLYGRRTISDVMCIQINKMHKILVIRLYFSLNTLRVSDCISLAVVWL